MKTASAIKLILNLLMFSVAATAVRMAAATQTMVNRDSAKGRPPSFSRACLLNSRKLKPRLSDTKDTNRLGITQSGCVHHFLLRP